MSNNAALSLVGGYRFRLARRVTSSCCAARRSNQEETHPTSGPERCAPGVRLLHRRSWGTSRRDILVPSRLSRHPCRSTPSAPIPLTLLTGLSVRAHSRAGRITAQRYPPKPRPVEKPQAAFSTLHKGFGSRTVPVRRQSAGVAQQVSRQDAEKAPMDHGWSFGACLRSGTGAKGV